MRRILGFASLCLLVVAPSLAGAPDDAVTVDPAVHRVVLENDYIRVFDARASVGAKSPMHTHPPMVLISLDTTRFRMTMPDGSKPIFDLNPGEVLWVPGAKHSWELLAGELHAIGVEIKSAQKAEPPPQPTAEDRSGDAVSVDPNVHHVLFENPHVRVFEGRASHGNSSPMHWHPATLLVSLDWIRLRLTQPDGSHVIHDFHPGEVLWFPDGTRHSWEALAGDTRVIAVEVKAAEAARPK